MLRLVAPTTGRIRVGNFRRLLLLALAAAIALTALLAAPRLLPALPGFEVRRVEVLGIELLEPKEVLCASGIRAGQSVWEDPARWEAALERHAVIEEASVARRLPGTLRVEIEEKEPVAYVPDGILAPVTASGERLPLDPSRAPADLPIARGIEDGEVPPALLAEIERLSRIDPGLFAEVSEIRARDPEGSILLLRHREADIVIPAGAQADRLVELRAVLADLEDRIGTEDSIEGVRVDLRFADQIVVRILSSVQKP